MLAEWLTRRVELRIAGRVWPLVFTHRALLACERLTGVEMLGLSLANLSAVLLRGLLFSALSASGADYPLEDVGALITVRNLPAIREALIQAWVASMAEPEKSGKPASPGLAQKLTWLDAWASARYELRLTDDEWLDMTPRQVGALRKLRMEQMQREELLVGILAATTENFSACHPKKPASAEAFMLHPYATREDAMTGEHIMAQLQKLKG